MVTGESSIPVEEQYDKALSLIESDQAVKSYKDSLKLGLNQMLALSDQNYVPAMFKIESIISSSDNQTRYVLLSLMGSQHLKKNFNKYNDLSYSLLTQIIVKNDTAFSNINAIAAYRLGCYRMDNKSNMKVNYDEAYKYFSKSEQWALLANDTLVAKDVRDIKIDASLLNDIKRIKEHINKINVHN